MRSVRRTMAVMLVAGLSGPLVAGERTVTLDVEEVALSELATLLAEQGCPRLAVEPEAAETPVTFAISNASRGEAVRWLCRVCRLAVVKREGALHIGRASIDEATVKEYKVGRLAPTAVRAEALAAFLRRVILGAFQNRVPNDAGELEPQLAVVGAPGKLRVLAPIMVQREAVTLLRAMVRAKKPLAYEGLRVKYEPYELGFLGARGAKPPDQEGEVSLDLEGATAVDAVRELTRASKKASFFVDPWDGTLAERKVTLRAEKLPVGVVARRMAEQLGVERVPYDGATLLVTAARKPIFESLVVRVYNLSGKVLGRSIADEVGARAKNIELPENLPYGIEMVGTLMLAAAPGPTHREFEELLNVADRLNNLPGGGRLPGGIELPR